MKKASKRMQSANELVDKNKTYVVEEAVGLLKKATKVKFDETVELYFRLGVDPKKADQMVRGVVELPHGTGKKVRILVLASEALAKEAIDAGADYAGSDEYFEKIKNGWFDFDVVVSTPDLMREVGKLGKVLGPKGLMPSPKAGTVTADVKKAVLDIKRGKIEFRVDKNANIAVGVGKVSFDADRIVQNVMSVVNAVVKAKPNSAKGDYLKGMYISTTMGPGIKLDAKAYAVA